MGDVVVEELNAGDIDWSSEVNAVVFKGLKWGITLGVFAELGVDEDITAVIAAEVFDIGSIDAERFSIAELRRIIILLVFGKSKLLPLINSFVWPLKLVPLEWCGLILGGIGGGLNSPSRGGN